MAASEDFRFPASNFIEEETPEKIFFSEFCKIFKNIFSFDRTPPDDCFLSLSVNFETFFNTSFIEHLEETAILCTSCWISTTRYSKNYFTDAFQAFYLRLKSSHSKVFIYLKSLKTVCEKVNLLEAEGASRRSQQMGSVKQGVPEKVTKFTRKHQCQSLLLNKVAGLRLYLRK